jgi:lipoprotein-anchoring transpeptidase ErfK/SrfK
MSKSAALATALILMSSGLSSPLFAQESASWAHEIFGRQDGGHSRPNYGNRKEYLDREDRQRLRHVEGGDVRYGGARPAIPPQSPAVVAFSHDFPANSIVINTSTRKLYYILPERRAYEYAISVGREGFDWIGTETVSRKQAWPDWHPPAEMRQRDPSLPEKMTGGLKNPLGAIALYLGDTLYRIHGTNDAKSIGRAASSGCFRMLNSQVLHLASLAEIGTQVHVVKAFPRREDISHAPAGAPESSSTDPTSPSSQPAAPHYQALRDEVLGRR